MWGEEKTLPGRRKGGGTYATDIGRLREDWQGPRARMTHKFWKRSIFTKKRERGRQKGKTTFPQIPLTS